MSEEKKQKKVEGGELELIFALQAGKGQDGWERPVMSAESERDGNRTLRTQHDHTKHHHRPHIHSETKASNQTKNAVGNGAQEVTSDECDDGGWLRSGTGRFCPKIITREEWTRKIAVSCQHYRHLGFEEFVTYDSFS